MGRKALVLGLGAALLQAVMVFAFAWPAARMAPRDLPIVVTGPGASAVVQKLDAGQPGAFKVKRLPDEAAARRALADREAYGAIVADPAGPRVLTASAASPVVAQLLTQAAGPSRSVAQDVVAADPDDPRGAAFGALVLPLIMSGLAAGALLTFLVRSAEWRAVGLVAFSVGAGLVTAAIVRDGLAVLPGSYWAVAGVIGLVSLAVSATVTGLAAVAGRVGLSLGAVLMMIIGNPLSGVTSAPELLPQPWGAIGQAMPAGAGGTLLRSVTFFDGARSGGPLTVLLIWAVAGLLLVAAGALRGRSSS